MIKQDFNWGAGGDAYNTLQSVAGITIDEDMSALLEHIADEIYWKKYQHCFPKGEITKNEDNVVTLTIKGSGRGDKKVRFAKFEGDHLVEIFVPYSDNYTTYRCTNAFKPFVTSRYACEYLRKASFPGFTDFGKGTLQYAFDLKTLEIPNLKNAGDSFLRFAPLETFNAPKLETVGDHFLYHNECLCSFNAPKMKKFGENSLYNNDSIRELSLPNVRTLPNGFMFANTKLWRAHMPKLQRVGVDCQPLFYDIVLQNKSR